MLVEAALAVALIAVLLGAGLLIVERWERRRRARWWHDHFHGGGLVRMLIARWNGPKRLTHRPDTMPDGGDEIVNPPLANR